MSARVFKPILMGEMPKMRSSPSLDGKLASRGITKVRRALFNTDPEENRRFLEEELAKLATDQAERWNFDFLSGRPKADSNSHYAWIPVRILPQRPVKHVIHQTPDISDMYAPITTTPTRKTTEDDKMSTDETPPRKHTPRKQLQSKITDFLSVRKRAEASASTSKKLPGSTPRPRKIPRLTTS